MKVLHVLSTNVFAGAENVACQIINLLKEEAGVELAYTSPFSKTLKTTLDEKGVHYIPLEKLSVKQLKNVIKSYKPDVIHSHDMKACFITSLANKKIPMVFHIHNNSFDNRKKTLKTVLFNRASRSAKHIIWVSKSAFSSYVFKDKIAEKSEVLPNIINIEELYTKLEQDKKRYDFDVSFVGRLSYPKNPERFLQVCSLLKEKRPDIKIGVVGDGELLDKTKEESIKLGLDHNISFMGYMTNPLKVIKDSKVLLMTSRWEGTPMVALEAEALGTPIISTPVDGLLDLVENGVDGFLSNNDEELRDAILDIVQNNKKREAMSKQLIEKARAYNNLNEYKQKILKSCKV